MAAEVTKKHPWHMVEPSPWPVVGTVAALTMAVGGIVYMHTGILWGFLAGVAILLITFFGWWRDVVRESESGAYHTPPVRHRLRVGMVLFIASEVMFFVAFFWAYFHSSMPILSLIVAEQWPPEGIVPLETWHIPFLNTMILLSSGTTVTWAHHALRAGDRPKAILDRAPHTVVKSSSIISAKASTPARRQNRVRRTASMSASGGRNRGDCLDRVARLHLPRIPSL